MKKIERKIIPLSLFVSMVLTTQLFAADKTVLEEVKISEKNDYYIENGTTEGVDSYTTKSMNTSTKLNLSPRETPQSIMVFTRQKLDDQNISSYQELLAKTPGVTLNKWDERVYPTARGFSIDYNLYDGMPTYEIADYGASDTDLIIYDRVEIVKGANGLMTGAGDPALGLNYIRKHANSREFTGTVDLSAGSWNDYRSTVDIQTPLNNDGSIRARVVAKHQDNESYMDNYEKSTNVLYGVVDMDLTDTTYLSVGASIEDINRSGVRWGGLPAFNSDGTRTNFDRSKTVSDDWTYWNNTTTSYYADLKQYINNDITLNLSYSNRKIDSETSLLYYYGTVDKTTKDASGLMYAYESEALEQEDNINLYASIPFKLGELNHEIVTGVGYNSFDFKKNNFGGTGYISASEFNFDNIAFDKPSMSATTSTLSLPSKTIQKGAYIAGKISLMDDLKLITGARLSSWEYEANNGDGNREFNNEITPYVGLIYDIDESHSVYTSYTSIFKPQNLKDSDDNYLDPIQGNNYELGIKGEYFEGNLNTSLAIFRIEQDGVGEKTGEVNSNLESIYESKDGVVSKGFELGISGNVTDNLSLDFGLANFEAKTADGEKFNTDSSRTTANIFAKYTLNDYRFGSGVNYKSKQYIESNLFDETITQDGYITVDLMAGYKVNKNVDLQLNVNNIFDEEYYEGIGDSSMVYGDPRNATISMKYTF
jgi:outer-membrane receptor for ferric coprogen and ferric-rhodotorulic acid